MFDTAVERPKSADLVDLHVFVVPVESWLGKYSVAYNNVAVQSTSAGFIRIDPDATLSTARSWMLGQLDSTILPNKFVFLRSVGRCMAVVNQAQELTLKTKHFLPPIAYSPEVFILPGTHEWIASLRRQTESIIVSKPPASQDYIVSQSKSNTPLNGKNRVRNNHAQNYEHESTLDLMGQDQTKAHEIAQQHLFDMHNVEQVTKDCSPSEMLSEIDMLKKGRSSFSAMLETVKKQPGSKQVSSNLNEQADYANVKKTDNNSDIRQTSIILNEPKLQISQPSKNHITPAIQVIHPEVLTHTVSRDGLTTPTPIPSANVVHSTLKYDHDSISSAGMESQDEIGLALKHNHSQYYPNESNDEDHSSEDHDPSDLDSRDNDVANSSHDENEAFTPHQITKDNEQDVSHLSGETPSINVPRSQELQKNDRYNIDAKITSRKADRRKEDKRILEEEKMKMENKKRSMEDDALRVMKDTEVLLQKKRDEEEKKKLEEQRKLQLEKELTEQKRAEVSRLEAKLAKVKENRLELQKKREQSLKEAREIKYRVTTMKATETNNWKKKYLNEKQRGIILEEEVDVIKSDITEHQKKLLKKMNGKETFEVDVEKSTSRVILGPSYLNNLKNEVQKLTTESRRLKMDIDRAKSLLKTESRRKTDAQTQLKELRNELSEKRKAPSLPKTDNLVS